MKKLLLSVLVTGSVVQLNAGWFGKNLADTQYEIMCKSATDAHKKIMDSPEVVTGNQFQELLVDVDNLLFLGKSNVNLSCSDLSSYKKQLESCSFKLKSILKNVNNGLGLADQRSLFFKIDEIDGFISKVHSIMVANDTVVALSYLVILSISAMFVFSIPESRLSPCAGCVGCAEKIALNDMIWRADRDEESKRAFNAERENCELKSLIANLVVKNISINSSKGLCWLMKLQSNEMVEWRPSQPNLYLNFKNLKF